MTERHTEEGKHFVVEEMKSDPVVFNVIKKIKIQEQLTGAKNIA